MIESDEDKAIRKQLNELVPTNRAGLLLRLHSQPQANTLVQYREKLLEYIQMRWNLDTLGMGMQEVNQRFCKLGKKFGISPRHLVMLLVGEGLIAIEPIKKCLVVLPVEYAQMLPEDRYTEALKELLMASVYKDYKVKDMSKEVDYEKAFFR